MERYGYCLPWTTFSVVWPSILVAGPCCLDVDFRRERLGELPTELIFHFFKSLSDNAKMNLNIKALGDNEHHKSESIFKAFALALKMAVRRDIYRYDLPSTKGLL